MSDPRLEFSSDPVGPFIAATVAGAVGLAVAIAAVVMAIAGAL